MRIGQLPVSLLLSVAVLAAHSAVPALAASTEIAAGQSTVRRADTPAQARHRPHLVIRPHPIRPGPTARRLCRAWLAQETRPSGPVIVPQMRCWWER